jgi:hypothetical protein
LSQSMINLTPNLSPPFNKLRASLGILAGQTGY